MVGPRAPSDCADVESPLVPQLAEAAEVLAVDLPGHGGSPPTAATPPEWALEVAGLLEQEGFRQPYAVGHSAGGWTAARDVATTSGFPAHFRATRRLRFEGGRSIDVPDVGRLRSHADVGRPREGGRRDPRDRGDLSQGVFSSTPCGEP